jgi:hypothetical protein
MTIMNHTGEALEIAISILLPIQKEAKFDLPVAIRMIAEDFFINSYNINWQPTNDERVALYIVQEAAICLKEHGMFIYGDLSFKE